MRPRNVGPVRILGGTRAELAAETGEESTSCWASPATPQGAKRTRPFARRAARTARPAFVLMRARKPWVRLRCKLLGWKVRFMEPFPVGRPGLDTALREPAESTDRPGECQDCWASRQLWITWRSGTRLLSPRAWHPTRPLHCTVRWIACKKHYEHPYGDPV